MVGIMIAKLRFLMELRDTICHFEANFPPSEARSRSKEFIKRLPAEKWQVLEEIVAVLTTPEGAKMMGWNQNSLSGVRDLFERAKLERMGLTDVSGLSD